MPFYRSSVSPKIKAIYERNIKIFQSGTVYCYKHFVKQRTNFSASGSDSFCKRRVARVVSTVEFNSRHGKYEVTNVVTYGV